MDDETFVLRIRTLCWAHDPIGLAADGAPLDEYDPEARTIAARLHEAWGEEDMARIVAQEFVAWFGPEVAGDPVDYRALGAAIWHLVSGPG